MAQEFERDSAHWTPGYELAGSLRDEIEECLARHLRNPQSVEIAILCIEDAIAEYKGFLSAGVNEPLQDKQVTMKELDALSSAAEALSRTLGELSPEARERLTELVEHASEPESDQVDWAPIVDPLRLRRLGMDSAVVAGRSEIAKQRVEEEKRRRGPRPDNAAWILSSLCLAIFEQYCEGSTAHCNRDESPPGPFQELLRLVFKAADVPRKADSYVRELHERQSGRGG